MSQCHTIWIACASTMYLCVVSICVSSDLNVNDLWRLYALSANTYCRHPSHMTAPPRCRRVKETTVMLSMKTGINTESTCVSPGVLRITRQEFITTYIKACQGTIWDITLLDTLYTSCKCYKLVMIFFLWGVIPGEAMDSSLSINGKYIDMHKWTEFLIIPKVSGLCLFVYIEYRYKCSQIRQILILWCSMWSIQSLSDTHLWRSLFRGLSHPCLWLQRLPFGLWLLWQGWLHSLRKFQLLRS